LRPSSRPFLQDFLHGAAVAQLLQRQTEDHQDLLSAELGESLQQHRENHRLQIAPALQDPPAALPQLVELSRRTILQKSLRSGAKSGAKSGADSGCSARMVDEQAVRFAARIQVILDRPGDSGSGYLSLCPYRSA
jgi:hypothetical protein